MLFPVMQRRWMLQESDCWLLGQLLLLRLNSHLQSVFFQSQGCFVPLPTLLSRARPLAVTFGTIRLGAPPWAAALPQLLQKHLLQREGCPRGENQKA